MISLGTLFWLMIILFGVIGALRGWTKEVIATSGLVLSLFTLNQFGAVLIGLLSNTPTTATAPIERQHFYILAMVHLSIAFFSYQGPAFAGTRVRDRLRVRDSVQDKLLGGLVGGLNGYLIFGTVWAFVEYQAQSAGNWVRLAPGVQYPFEPTVLLRPDIGLSAYTLMERLPLPMLAPYLPILVVVVFLFVIVVMI